MQYAHLADKQPEFLRLAEESGYNELDLRGKRGVITCGITENYLLENLEEDHDFSILSIRQYPVPVKKLRQLVEHVDELLVVEDGYPLVEESLRGLFGLDGVEVRGRLSGELPRTGELNPDLVRKGLGLPERSAAHAPSTQLAMRPPMLCKGCPHDDSFRALTAALAEFEEPQVFSDIGCYTLAALPPLEAIHSCVAMGASIGMAAGAAHSGYHPAVCAIGDSTFAHGGIPPMLSAVQQNVAITVLVLDNDTVGMTGTQRSMATGSTLDQIIRGTGVDPEHIRIIEPVPKKHEENVRVFREELNFRGPSVIIARRPCIEAIKHGIA